MVYLAWFTMQRDWKEREEGQSVPTHDSSSPLSHTAGRGRWWGKATFRCFDSFPTGPKIPIWPLWPLRTPLALLYWPVAFLFNLPLGQAPAALPCHCSSLSSQKPVPPFHSSFPSFHHHIRSKSASSGGNKWADPIYPELISLVMIILGAKGELHSTEGLSFHWRHCTRQEDGDGNGQFKTSTSVGACVVFPGKTV